MRSSTRAAIWIFLLSFSCLAGAFAESKDERIARLKSEVEARRVALLQSERELAAATGQPAPVAEYVPVAEYKGYNPVSAADVSKDCPTKPEPRLSWEISFSSTFGYNTNPQSLPDDLLRTFAGPKSSIMTRLNPSITFSFEQDEETTWSAKYDVLREYYHDAADLDTDTHTFQGVWSKDYNHKMFNTTFSVTDTLFRGERDTQSNQLDISPTVTWNFGPEKEWALLGSYAFTKTDGHNGPKFFQDDIDSLTHKGTVGLGRKFICVDHSEKFLIDTGIAYTFAKVDAEGDNSDLTRHQISARAGGWFFPDKAPYCLRNLHLAVEYAHKFNNYEHSNVTQKEMPSIMLGGLPMTLTLFDSIQISDRDELDVVFQLPIGVPCDTAQPDVLMAESTYFKKKVSALLYGTMHYERVESNLRGKDYDQLLLLGGVKLTF